MWFDPELAAVDWSEAEAFLRRDPHLGPTVERVGPCGLRPLADPYLALVLSVFNQQLSMKGAETLYARFVSRFSRKTPTPRKVVAALDPASPTAWDEATARHCGLSRQKRGYLLDLSRRLVDRRLSLPKLADLDDGQVVAELTAVKGIGVWTAEMYLMFVLSRPDVLPVGDLGLREGVRGVFGLAERPDPAAVTRLAAAWRPWRSVATWYCWKHKGD